MNNNQKYILVTGGSGFIGTNLIDLFIKNNLEFVNFDKAEPLKKSHSKFWFKGNLLHLEDLRDAMDKFKPAIIIHLAARTDTLSDNLNDYIDNTEGTNNLLKCIKEYDFIDHIVITSTQYVYKSDSNPFPDNDDTYKPHTIYGQSKVITEQYVKDANLNCKWTIIRPANIWGPWHMRYPIELWRMIDKGFYVHASRKEVIRTYGYVKNVAHQILEIITTEKIDVNKKMFYLGDLPIDSYIWLNEISNQLQGKNIKKLPSYLFHFPAKIGDILLKLGVKFPLYSTRYKNMIEDYYAPTNHTISLFGLHNPDIKENIAETISWIKDEGKEFFPYWENKN